MMMDLASIVRMDTPGGIAFDMGGILAPYVMERYFKHLAVREWASSIFFQKRGSRGFENANA